MPGDGEIHGYVLHYTNASENRILVINIAGSIAVSYATVLHM